MKRWTMLLMGGIVAGSGTMCSLWLYQDEPVVKYTILTAVVATAICYVAYLGLWLWFAVEKAGEQRENRKAKKKENEITIVRDDNGGIWIGEEHPGRLTWRAAHLDPRPIQTPGVEVVPDHLAIWNQFQLARRTVGGRSGDASFVQPAVLPAIASAELPQRVNLTDLLSDAPSLRKIVLGVTIGVDGHQQVVYGDMQEMVHVAIGGSSGFGKSKCLQTIGYQLATASENVLLALIDLEENSLAPFAAHHRLFTDMAVDEQGALHVVARLRDEMDRRKVLFVSAGAENWIEYNARRPDDPMPVIAVLADEANDILMSRMTNDAMQVLARRMRKYGMWLIMAAQEWKIGDVDGKIRRQLSTKLQFRVNDLSQARVLVGREGAQMVKDAPRGRCVAMMPGHGLLQLQAPYIGRDDIIRAMTTGKPAFHTPEIVEVLTNEEKRIAQAIKRGLSDAKICEEVWGYKSSNKYPEIDRVRQKLDVHVQ